MGGVDVMVYASGPGRERFVGSVENMQLGQRIAELMGWDLEEETARLGTPVMAPHDVLPETRAAAPWS